jgi:hypothetical protein
MWEEEIPMPASLEYLERCSAQTGYQVVALEKVTRLGEIAGEIGRHPSLRDALALKGGTAINLCPGPPTRMSVDLDFNFVACADRHAMVQARPAMEKALTDLVRRLGYQVQQSSEAAASRKFYATYRSVLGPNDRIELDINYLWRTPLAGVRRAELWQPGELERPLVTVVSDEELWVGKFLAFLDRTAPRDAWDIARLPSIVPGLAQSPSFRQWLVAMSCILDHPIATYDFDRLKSRLTAEVIESQLHPMLTRGDRPDPGELLATAWHVAQPFVTLRPAEAEFASRMQRAELNVSLIFGDDDKAARRFETHPQVMWKIQNLRRHIGHG